MLRRAECWKTPVKGLDPLAMAEARAPMHFGHLPQAHRHQPPLGESLARIAVDCVLNRTGGCGWCDFLHALCE